MQEQLIDEILEKLKNGELSEYYVKKDEFLLFRNVIVNRVDFKHYRGIAKHGGDVVYSYMEMPRS